MQYPHSAEIPYIGDTLFYMSDHGECHKPTVIRKTVEKSTGVYAPLTMDGFFLANGFLVTCYADITNFDLAHMTFAPLRWWYKLFASPTKSQTDQGIHVYAQTLMKMRKLLPKIIRNQL